MPEFLVAPHLFTMVMKAFSPLDRMIIESKEFLDVHGTRIWKASAKNFTVVLNGAIGDDELRGELNEGTFKFTSSELRSQAPSISGQPQTLIGFLFQMHITSTLTQADFNDMPIFVCRIRPALGKVPDSELGTEIVGFFMTNSGTYSGAITMPRINYAVYLEDPIDLDANGPQLSMRSVWLWAQLKALLLAAATANVNLTMIPLTVKTGPEINLDNLSKMLQGK